MLLQLAKLDELEGVVAPLVDRSSWTLFKQELIKVRTLERELRFAGVWPVPLPKLPIDETD